MNNLTAKLKSYLNLQKLFNKERVQMFFMWVSLKDQIQLIKQLAVLMKAGIPLFTTLGMLKEQSTSRSLKKIIEQVVSDVENGHYLATSLGKFKRIFGELTINIIAVGEISGNLTSNLEHLAVTLKKKQALRRKVIGASIYPIFIIFATLAITILLTVFIFPKIIPVFKSINYQLPWTTRFLIWITVITKGYGLVISASVIALVIGFASLLQIKKVRLWYDNGLLYIPFIKTIVRTYNTTNICRTIGLLLVSRTTVVRAFEIASNTTKNLTYKKELHSISENITRGEIISSNLQKNKKLFPIAVPQMIAVAESTGKLSETFEYLADVYEEEMDELTRNISTTVEPMLLIFMGILVGFIAISIITPIYGITQHLTPK